MARQQSVYGVVAAEAGSLPATHHVHEIHGGDERIGGSQLLLGWPVCGTASTSECSAATSGSCCRAGIIDRATLFRCKV